MFENNSETTPPSLSSQSWLKCIDLLKNELDSHVFTAYIEPLQFINADERSITLSAPSSFLKTYVERYLRDHITSALSQNCSTPSPDVVFTLHEREEGSSTALPAAKQFVVVKKVRTANQPEQVVRKPGELPYACSLNPRYTFASFVVGNSNQFCHAAAMRVAESPGMSYNPLFIYGGVGLGKTHLLHAIGNALLERKPSANIVYMSSETFTNELILALRNAKMDEFKRRLRNVELLLIDDIQFMRGKERTQEEFFHTFNALYNAKHQIVITSDKLPSEIPGIEERLQTRFSWGLTADMQAPDFETRVAILRRKALLDGISLPDSVTELIADRISSNVRELEGALTRLTATSSIQNVPITLELTNTALKALLQPRTINISVDDIKKAVSTHFSIKVSEMISKRRTKNLSFPRHVAMYLCRKHTTASYPEIGGQFGGRDHSSVIHAASVVAEKVKKDPTIAALVEEIERRLLGGGSSVVM